MTFRINRVYTRAGDDGQTGLVGGERVAKDSLRVAAYGDIDELNSVLGIVVACLTESTEELRPVLQLIQQELFDVGSELATPTGKTYPGMWCVQDDDVKHLEELCDKFGSGLPELTSFILPGGTTVAAFLHLARTVCRRAERQIVALARETTLTETTHTEAAPFNQILVSYVNRLSDLFFILARWSLEREGQVAPLWVPAAKRVPL